MPQWKVAILSIKRERGVKAAAMAVLAVMLAACNGNDQQREDLRRVDAIKKDFVRRRLALCRSQLERIIPGTFLANARDAKESDDSFSVSPDASFKDLIAAAQKCDARFLLAIGAKTQAAIDRAIDRIDFAEGER